MRQGGPQLNTSLILLGGKADFVMLHNSGEMFSAFKERTPLVAIASYYQKGPQAIPTHKGQDKDSLGSLKGSAVILSQDALNSWWPWLKLKYGYTDDQIRPYPSIVPDDAGLDTYPCWTTSGVDGCAWHETNAETLIARCSSAICWTSNEDGVPISVNTLNKALRIMGYDTSPGGDHCAHGLHSTAPTPLDEDGAFDGDIMEAQLAHDTEKKSASGAASAEGAVRLPDLGWRSCDAERTAPQ